jgi:hypothetical protein
MANQWVNFIKSYIKDKPMTYSHAMKLPEVKQAYQKIKKGGNITKESIKEKIKKLKEKGRPFMPSGIMDTEYHNFYDPILQKYFEGLVPDYKLFEIEKDYKNNNENYEELMKKLNEYERHLNLYINKVEELE